MAITTILVRLGLSLLVGAIIGLDRELEHKPAGLRTMILVCLGSTVFMLIGAIISIPGLEQGRIIAGVITGIGFLGAGAIIRTGADVQGMTTAATIWLVSGLGLAVGCGAYALAIITCLLSLVVLRLLHVVERSFHRK
jgi:putative Mg2+ transporter-C (MgtC) family protein